MGFLDEVIANVQQDVQTIVLPESDDRRVVEAAAQAVEAGIAKVVLIGDGDAVRKAFPDVDLSGVDFSDPARQPKMDEMVDLLVELRKHKGMTPEQARTMLADPTPYGIMLVKMGLADGLVAGAVNTTADTLRPALQILKTKPGTRLVSAFFLMDVPDCDMGEDGMFLMADCALNIDPSAEELAQIAVASARTWETLTDRPARVGLLSFSTLGSGKGESVDKVRQAAALAKEMAPDLMIEGELQADAAIVPKVAALKAPDNPVAGAANCLIFPDINAGNIGYKLVQRLAKAEAYGPMLQGIAKPVNDLSRGCSTSDIVGVIALTALQAIGDKATDR